jgi:hypothetical protein
VFASADSSFKKRSTIKERNATVTNYMIMI